MFPSIITDELSSDPETGFEIGLEWGVNHFELRGVHDRRIPRISNYSRQRLVNAVKNFGVSITTVSPGLFKIPFPDSEPRFSNLGWMDSAFYQSWDESRRTLDDHRVNLLPESLEFASDVGARFLIAFSFSRNGARGGSAPNGVVEVLTDACEQASMAGIELLVENEEGHWADTGKRSAALIKRVGHPALGLNWDPANALIEGDVPFPHGYFEVRNQIRNVHFKDACRYGDGSWSIVEDGDVNWEDQILALHADNYRGAIAMEPHLSPPVGSTRDSLSRLRTILQKIAN